MFGGCLTKAVPNRQTLRQLSSPAMLLSLDVHFEGRDEKKSPASLRKQGGVSVFVIKPDTGDSCASGHLPRPSQRPGWQHRRDALTRGQSAIR